ncbi:MAG: GFA family protein [Methylocystaceae bacterium]|nr:GFA family protein [Methylocystaceae bacterium]
MTKKWMNGSCLCGEITYQVKDISERLSNCHCKMCRKFHGAAYATYAAVTPENFNFLSGETLIAAYQAPNGTTRKFCPNCGTSLFFESATGSNDHVYFALSTLDAAAAIKPSAHIFTKYKADWSFVDDGLPCYEEERGSSLYTKKAASD